MRGCRGTCGSVKPLYIEHMRRWLRWFGISVFVVAALLAILALSFQAPPSFQFLKGREPLKLWPQAERILRASGRPFTLYSFRADFDRVCKAARRELASKGFKEVPQVRTGSRTEILEHGDFGKIVAKGPGSVTVTLSKEIIIGDDGYVTYSPGMVLVSVEHAPVKSLFDRAREWLAF
jgi:hypothetical protein